ncbi:MAG: MmcQ/YjbR family DNA-binding protein [Oscillospiraceae bacterium]|nr:MmcQ/YjbR family DNA-binding protein [Oscillospiraceae bacterium]
MTRQDIIDYCLTYPDAYEDYPFDELPKQAGAWTVMRHRGNKKSFALIFERDGLCVNLKCEPLRADLLRQLYEGISPTYHMNKVHWNTLRAELVPAELLHELIEHSYSLTMPKKGKAGKQQP